MKPHIHVEIKPATRLNSAWPVNQSFYELRLNFFCPCYKWRRRSGHHLIKLFPLIIPGVIFIHSKHLAILCKLSSSQVAINKRFFRFQKRLEAKRYRTHCQQVFTFYHLYLELTPKPIGYLNSQYVPGSENKFHPATFILIVGWKIFYITERMKLPDRAMVSRAARNLTQRHHVMSEDADRTGVVSKAYQSKIHADMNSGDPRIFPGFSDKTFYAIEFFRIFHLFQLTFTHGCFSVIPAVLSRHKFRLACSTRNVFGYSSTVTIKSLQHRV